MFQLAHDRGQRARWKAAGSADRRVPLLIPSLVRSGRHSVRWTLYREARGLRGPENPALCCRLTFVCPCVCLRLSVFVCASIVSGLVLFWCIVLFSLFWLILFSSSSLICPPLLFFLGVSVKRRTVVGAIDESRPGLHSGRLWRSYNKWASVTEARSGETLFQHP